MLNYNCFTLSGLHIEKIRFQIKPRSIATSTTQHDQIPVEKADNVCMLTLAQTLSR